MLCHRYDDLYDRYRHAAALLARDDILRFDVTGDIQRYIQGRGPNWRPARRHGRSGSSFAEKIFMGEDFEEARRAVRSTYAKCRVLRPESIRSNSTGVYLVGLS